MAGKVASNSLLGQQRPSGNSWLAYFNIKQWLLSLRQTLKNKSKRAQIRNFFLFGSIVIVMWKYGKVAGDAVEN